jgi:HPt (histidine-containing phosphotransfer) domain-containing protein
MNYDLDAFDDEMFEEARSLMKDRFSEIVDGYLEDAVMYIDKIEEGFNSNDSHVIVQYAHPLKSSSAGLGVTSVSLIAKDLEYEAKKINDNESSVDHLRPLLDLIKDAFQRSETKLKQSIE